jgi:phenylalanine-4-hydroxylase
MKESAPIVEYGAAIDPKIMIEPPDVAELELEAGHPGLGDAGYVQRRKQLFALCRQHRLKNLGPPLIEYTPEETRIWREVSPKLEELHQKHASRIYLQAKRTLGISQIEIPQLRHLSERLTRETNMHLVPAEGPLPYRTFYRYIGERGFPVTQFIRHGSHPEFTPEPDMIHDCLGHVPPLMNRDYAELLTLIGKAASTTNVPEQVLALKRFSWFSVEFGLIEEQGETKVFGAGILSSTGEIPFSLSKNVRHRPFVTDEVIETDYDPSRMQDLLFTIPSFTFLRCEIEQLVKRFRILVDGADSSENDAQLADWNTYYRLLLSDKLRQYRGSHITIYNGKILAQGHDPAELRARVSEELGVPPERLVIPFVDPEEGILVE